MITMYNIPKHYRFLPCKPSFWRSSLVNWIGENAIWEYRTSSFFDSAIEHLNLIISWSTIDRCFIDDSSIFNENLKVR